METALSNILASVRLPDLLQNMAIVIGNALVSKSICIFSAGMESAGNLFNNVICLWLKSLILSLLFILICASSSMRVSGVLSSPNLTKNRVSNPACNLPLSKAEIPRRGLSFESIREQLNKLHPRVGQPSVWWWAWTYWEDLPEVLSCQGHTLEAIYPDVLVDHLSFPPHLGPTKVGLANRHRPYFLEDSEV